MKNRHLSQALPETTKTAIKPQPQSLSPKVRVALNTDFALGELLSDRQLQQFRASCERFNTNPSTLIASMLSSWLEKSASSPEMYDEPEEYSVTISNRHVSPCGARVFRDLIAEAMSTKDSAQRRRKLAGILDLLAPHVGLKKEMAGIRSMLDGEDDLRESITKHALCAESNPSPWTL